MGIHIPSHFSSLRGVWTPRPGTGRDRLCDFHTFVEAGVKPLVSSERIVHLILFGIPPNYNLGAVYSVCSLECESAERGRPHTGWESLQHSGKMDKNKISLRF